MLARFNVPYKNKERLEVISVVMLSYKRPENVSTIVNELKKNKLIGEIIVWNNNPEEPLSFQRSIENVKVINQALIWA